MEIKLRYHRLFTTTDIRRCCKKIYCSGAPFSVSSFEDFVGLGKKIYNREVIFSAPDGLSYRINPYLNHLYRLHYVNRDPVLGGHLRWSSNVRRLTDKKNRVVYGSTIAESEKPDWLIEYELIFLFSLAP